MAFQQEKIGKYTLLENIGHGSMGRTYLAEDQSGRKVCLKELRYESDLEKGPQDALQLHKLFHREAETLRKLRHRKVPGFYELFTAERNGRKKDYIAMEYVEGKNLADLVKEGFSPSSEEVVEIAFQVVEALKYLHHNSIIHRDVTPSNIRRKENGKPVGELVLVDYGGVRDLEAKLSEGSTLFGTYGYAPIESFRGIASPATDIYSLGNVMIYLLTGREPIDYTDQQCKVDMKVVTSLIRKRHGSLDKQLACLLEEMTQFAAEKRLSSMDKLESKLIALREGYKKKHTKKSTPPKKVKLELRQQFRKLKNIFPRYLYRGLALAWLGGIAAGYFCTTQKAYENWQSALASKNSAYTLAITHFYRTRKELNGVSQDLGHFMAYHDCTWRGKEVCTAWEEKRNALKKEYSQLKEDSTLQMQIKKYETLQNDEKLAEMAFILGILLGGPAAALVGFGGSSRLWKKTKR